MDMEKVIKGIECHRKKVQTTNAVSCLECPYSEPNQIREWCMRGLMDDIYALLKEQEPKIGHWILDPDGMDWNIPAWRCSECGNRRNGLPTIDCDETNIYLYAGSKFCPNCGAKMRRE